MPSSEPSVRDNRPNVGAAADPNFNPVSPVCFAIHHDAHIIVAHVSESHINMVCRMCELLVLQTATLDHEARVSSNPLPVLPRFVGGASYEEQSATLETGNARRGNTISPAFQTTILPDPTAFDPSGTRVNRK